MEEIWKDVIGYEGLYSISNFGRIKSFFKRGSGVNFKKPTSPKNHYPAIILYKNGNFKTIYMHRLIAIHFIPNPENKPCVNHINKNKHDYRIENLEWVTHVENSLHGHADGVAKSTPISLEKDGQKLNFATTNNALRFMGYKAGHNLKVAATKGKGFVRGYKVTFLKNS